MSELNYIETPIVPDSPKVVPNEVLHVYVPKTGYRKLGLAKFNKDDFLIDSTGEVRLAEHVLLKGISDNTAIQNGCFAGQKCFILNYDPVLYDKKFPSKWSNSYDVSFVRSGCEDLKEFSEQLELLQEAVDDAVDKGSPLKYSIRLTEHRYNYGHITSVTLNSENGLYSSATINVDNLFYEPTIDNIPYIWVLDKPEIGTEDIGFGAFAIGDNSSANGRCSATFGYDNKSYGWYSFTTGRLNFAGYAAIAAGLNNLASGVGSFAIGDSNQAIGKVSHAEGYLTKAEGENAHTEGRETKATGDYGHAEGYLTEVTGGAGHAEGTRTKAIGYSSHAEGEGREGSGAFANFAHVEGVQTTVTVDGTAGHAEGYNNTVSGKYAHAQGTECAAEGKASHAGGIGVIARAEAQTVIGRYNSDNSDALFIIGDGTSQKRGNAFEVGKDDSGYFIKLGNTIVTEESLARPALPNAEEVSV